MTPRISDALELLSIVALDHLDELKKALQSMITNHNNYEVVS